MRLAILDTNIIISAGIQPRGAPFSIVMDWVLDRLVQLITCPSIVSEYREVARREKFKRYGFPPVWLESVIAESLQLPEPEPWPYRCPDPKDAVFLSLANISGAWLVTGNLKHYPENVCQGVRVLSPLEYLAHLRAEAVHP